MKVFANAPGRKAGALGYSENKEPAFARLGLMRPAMMTRLMLMPILTAMSTRIRILRTGTAMSIWVAMPTATGSPALPDFSDTIINLTNN